MKRLIIVGLISTVLLSSCTNESVATQTLLDSGYTNPTHLGYSAFACSSDDHFADKYQVTAPSGNRIEVVVCSGLFKGATIRHL